MIVADILRDISVPAPGVLAYICRVNDTVVS